MWKGAQKQHYPGPGSTLLSLLAWTRHVLRRLSFALGSRRKIFNEAYVRFVEVSPNNKMWQRGLQGQCNYKTDEQVSWC